MQYSISTLFYWMKYNIKCPSDAHQVVFLNKLYPALHIYNLLRY